MRNTGQVIDYRGNLYAVCEHDGRLYVYDPQRHIPCNNRGAGLEGLGDTANTAWGATNVALNFVPGVGPILSAISSIAQGIFGGGDPTPIEDVWQAVIDTREQLAAAINAYYGAGSDLFVVPPGLDRRGDGDNAGGALAAQITANVMQLPSADRHKVKRDSEYAAINAMRQQLAQLSDALKTRGIIAQVQASIVPASPAPAPAPALVPAGATAIATPAGTSAVAVAPPAQNADYSKWLPWLLPIGALLLYSRL